MISGFACAVAIFAVLGVDYFILHSHLAYFLFFLFLLIVSSIELCRIAGVKSRWIILLGTVFAGVLASLPVLSMTLLREVWPQGLAVGILVFIYYFQAAFLVMIAWLLLLLLPPVLGSRIRSRTSLQDISVSVFAVTYIGCTGCYLLGVIPAISILNGDSFSHSVLLWFICTTKANDILGYLIGSSIGKHPLNSVSPKKTVEGAVAGLTGGILISLLIVSLFLSNWLSWYSAVLFGIIVGVAAQMGDLAESLIKRLCGVKDSGNLIPGSGGALDFIDCFLFAAPAAYYFLLFTV